MLGMKRLTDLRIYIRGADTDGAGGLSRVTPMQMRLDALPRTNGYELILDVHHAELRRVAAELEALAYAIECSASAWARAYRP